MRYTKLATIALLGVMLVAGMGCMNKGRELYEQERVQIEAAVGEFMTRPDFFLDCSGNLCVPACYNYSIYSVNPTPRVNHSVVNVIGPDVIEGAEYYVIAICPLSGSSYPKGILKFIPASVHPRNAYLEGHNLPEEYWQNCSSRSIDSECSYKCPGSYVWLTTMDGDIASICIGAECAAHGEDGYQGVYP